MKLSSVKKKLKNQKWWLEECPASVFLFDNICKAFTRGEAITDYPTLKEMLAIYKDGQVFEITPYEGKTKNFEYFLKQELRRPGFTEKKFQGWIKLIKTKVPKLNNAAFNGLDALNQKQLLEYAKRLIQVSSEANVYAVMIECVDPFSEKWGNYFTKKYRNRKGFTNDAFVFFSMPRQASFLTKEKTDFLKLCLGKISMDAYLKRWHWINTNYGMSKDITKKQLAQKIKNELLYKGKKFISKEIQNTASYQKRLIEQKRQMVSTLKPDKKDKIVFKLLEIFGYFIDIRKESMIRYTYGRDKLLMEIAARYKLPLQTLRNMRDKEVLGYLSGEKVGFKEIKYRHKYFAAFYTPKNETIYHKQKAKKLYQAYIKTLKAKILQGQVASAPEKILEGKVSIVLDAHKDKFKPGNILVTTMTRPEFMPLMRRAGAVITDEGGVTCHAAIISRELGIPCIIGAKHATKTLKNNQSVQMNLNTGIIKLTH